VYQDIHVGGNCDLHGHTVALKRRNGGDNPGVVLATAKILTLEFLLCPIQKGPIKNPRLCEASIPQRFEQLIFIEFLRACDFNSADRGPLLNTDDQHIAFKLNADIFKKSRGKQCSYRLRGPLLSYPITDLNWEIRKHRAGLDPLKALYPDIANGHPKGWAAGCCRRPGKLGLGWAECGQAD